MQDIQLRFYGDIDVDMQVAICRAAGVFDF